MLIINLTSKEKYKNFQKGHIFKDFFFMLFPNQMSCFWYDSEEDKLILILLKIDKSTAVPTESCACLNIIRRN